MRGTERREGQAETRRRGSARARWTVPLRQGLCPCKPVCTQVCTQHPHTYHSRMLYSQLCFHKDAHSADVQLHTGVTQRHKCCHTHTRQLTEDTLLPVTPHKFTDVLSKEQICTHTHCSPYSKALGYTLAHIHVPYIDICPPQAHAQHQHMDAHQKAHISAHPCAHTTPHCPCCPLSALSHADGLTRGNTGKHTCFLSSRIPSLPAQNRHVKVRQGTSL